MLLRFCNDLLTPYMQSYCREHNYYELATTVAPVLAITASRHGSCQLQQLRRTKINADYRRRICLIYGIFWAVVCVVASVTAENRNQTFYPAHLLSVSDSVNPDKDIGNLVRPT